MLRGMGAKSEVASRQQIQNDLRHKSKRKVRKYKNTARALEKQMRESKRYQEQFQNRQITLEATARKFNNMNYHMKISSLVKETDPSLKTQNSDKFAQELVDQQQ